MGFEPPGLDKQPDDRALVGFASLMPTVARVPGLLGRVVRLPVAVVAVPFRVLGRILALPGRLLGGHTSNSDGR